MVAGGCVGVVMEDSHFVPTYTAVLVTDDGDDAECCDAVEDLQLFYASLQMCE